MEVLETQIEHATRFLSLFKRRCRHNGKEFDWFFSSRSKNPVSAAEKTADAVVIVSVYDDQDDLSNPCDGYKGTPKLVLTSEFRVPINAREISFPAGIIDPGQTPAEAAVRELKEETGLDLEVLIESPNLFSSAGMTDESSMYVFGKATGEASKEHLEAHEDIDVLLLDEDGLRSFDYSANATSCKAWPLIWMYMQMGFENFPNP